MEVLLRRIATSVSPRFHALIDTGALITGYSNQEVAQKLLSLGLSWCEGIIFLDDDDRQQVTSRVYAQCNHLAVCVWCGEKA